MPQKHGEYTKNSTDIVLFEVAPRIVNCCQAVGVKWFKAMWCSTHGHRFKPKPMSILDSVMFLCCHNQVQMSFGCHYVVIICSGSPRLCEFLPPELVFIPREVKILPNQGRPMFVGPWSTSSQMEKA